MTGAIPIVHGRIHTVLASFALSSDVYHLVGGQSIAGRRVFRAFCHFLAHIQIHLLSCKSCRNIQHTPYEKYNIYSYKSILSGAFTKGSKKIEMPEECDILQTTTVLKKLFMQ